jgi:hypothetical protein
MPAATVFTPVWQPLSSAYHQPSRAKDTPRPVSGLPTFIPKRVISISRSVFSKSHSRFFNTPIAFAQLATEFQVAQENDVVAEVANADIRRLEVAGDRFNFADQQHGHSRISQVLAERVHMIDQIAAAQRKTIAREKNSALGLRSRKLTPLRSNPSRCALSRNCASGSAREMHSTGSLSAHPQVRKWRPRVVLPLPAPPLTR